MSWIEVQVGGRPVRVAIVRTGEGAWIGWNGQSRYLGSRNLEPTRQEGPERDIRAPMTGRVVGVMAKPGLGVRSGEVLVILEAMKIEYRLGAPRAGTVATVECAPGSRVDLGQVLVTLEP